MPQLCSKRVIGAAYPQACWERMIVDACCGWVGKGECGNASGGSGTGFIVLSAAGRLGRGVVRGGCGLCPAMRIIWADSAGVLGQDHPGSMPRLYWDRIILATSRGCVGVGFEGLYCKKAGRNAADG